MPLDKGGKFHNSTQRAMFADRGAKGGSLKLAGRNEPEEAGGEGGGNGQHSELHDHEDGT